MINSLFVGLMITVIGFDAWTDRTMLQSEPASHDVLIMLADDDKPAAAAPGESTAECIECKSSSILDHARCTPHLSLSRAESFPAGDAQIVLLHRVRRQLEHVCGTTA